MTGAEDAGMIESQPTTTPEEETMRGTIRTCGKCKGSGAHWAGACYPCGGTGAVRIFTAAEKAADAADDAAAYEALMASDDPYAVGIRARDARAAERAARQAARVTA